jgi:hypothetical protein
MPGLYLTRSGLLLADTNVALGLSVTVPVQHSQNVFPEDVRTIKSWCAIAKAIKIG